MIDNLPNTEYYTLVITVPETDANAMRDVLAKAGAGKIGNYTHCTFSVKGIGRFLPTSNAHPHVGEKETLDSIVEERIETLCTRDLLEPVITAIKKAHPYETTIIDIYPVYKIGLKLTP